MITALLSAATATLFGSADFLGGLASRRESAFVVTATAHLVGVVVLGVAALLFPWQVVGASDVTWGAVAGVSGGIGVVSLYGALAAGRMSVVAPITAALSGSLPALYDFASRGVPGLFDVAGLALALAAIVMVSAATDEHGQRGMPLRATLLSVVAGFGFAGSFISFSMTAPESGLWPLAVARVVSAVSLALVAAVRVQGTPIAGVARGTAVLAGMLDSAANVTMLSAIRIGPLAVASVIGSMYPVATVLLALTVLRERVLRLQWAGIALALVAVVLTSLG